MGLLKRVGHRFGYDDVDLVPLMNQAEKNSDHAGIMPRFATELQYDLDDRLRRKELDMKDVLDTGELELYKQRKATAVKIVAASECRKIALKDESEIGDELEYLRRLPDIIPCVVTTNYDTLLEDEIFGGEFKVYSAVSDYYISGSQGIGEIYKIHGTCTDPSTMILDDDDYAKFRDRAKIVSAKILSVLCDYPMVILGYSLEDADVKEILDNLISSLDDDKLRQVEKNILYVEYDEDAVGITDSTYQVRHEDHVMSLRSIRTKDFGPIFREIALMEASVSPMTIRKIRQVVKKVQVVEGSRGERFKCIGLDDISSEDADKLVVVITDQNNLRSLETIPRFSVDSMLREILFDEPPSCDPDTFVRLFMVNGKMTFGNKDYVPIFHYMEKSGHPDEFQSNNLSEFIREKKKQFTGKLNGRNVLKLSHENDVESYSNISGKIDNVESYVKPLVVMHYYDLEIIDEEEALQLLRVMYQKELMEGTFKTNFRCAVSYISFKKLYGSVRDRQGPTGTP